MEPDPSAPSKLDAHQLAFKLTLPSAQLSSQAADIAQEIAEKLARDGTCRVSDIHVEIESFIGTVMVGLAHFAQVLSRERARVIVKQSPAITNYVGHKTLESRLEVVEEGSDGTQRSGIRVEPLVDYVDPMSLFNTFHSHGPIHSLSLDSSISPHTGSLIRTGTLTFSHPSSSTSILGLDPASVYDPYTTVLYPLRAPESASEHEFEERLRAVWEDAVDVRVVGWGTEGMRVLIRCEAGEEEGEVKEFEGMRVERMMLALPGVALCITDLGPTGNPQPSAEDSSMRSTLFETFQPSSPPPVSAVPPTRDPTPETEVAPMDVDQSMAPPPVQPHLELPPSPPAATNDQPAPRAPWLSTLKPYPYPSAVLRQHRDHEPIVRQGYSVCELPAGDAERRRDVMLAYGGQAWPDFTAESFPTKKHISDDKARRYRWDQDAKVLHASTQAAKAADIAALESLWARTDVPDPAWELSDQERRAIEASLVDVTIGLERQQKHDEMMFKSVRNREAPGQRMGLGLVEMAGLGIDKTPQVVDPRARRA